MATYLQHSPSVIEPDGGERLDALFTCKANIHPDNLHDIVVHGYKRYQMEAQVYYGPYKGLAQIAEDEWHTFLPRKSITTAMLTSKKLNPVYWKFNFGSYASTNSGRVRYRVYNSYEKKASIWHYSATLFEIVNNIGVAAPTGLSPVGGIYDMNNLIKFSWKYNGSTPQKSFQFQWRIDGGIWNATNVDSSVPEFYLDGADVFTVPGKVEWNVVCFGQNEIVGQFSSTVGFTISALTTAPTILVPLPNAVVIVPNPMIQWASTNQADFGVRVRDIASDTIVHTESHTGEDSAQSYYLYDYDLANAKGYEFLVKTKDATSGMWSEESSVEITTSFTPPEKALVEWQMIAPDKTDSVPPIFNGGPMAYLTISNPVGGQPVVRNDLYRIDYYLDKYLPNAYQLEGHNYATYTFQGRTKLIKTAVDMGEDNGAGFVVSGAVDYLVGSGYYNYFVRTWASNGSYIDSDYDANTIKLMDFEGFVLSPSWMGVEAGGLETYGSDALAGAIYVDYFADDKGEASGYETTYKDFFGRKYSAVEIGEGESNGYTINFDLIYDIDIISFNRLVGTKRPVLYRDENGTRFYTMIDKKNFKFTQFKDVFKVSLTLNKIDFVDYEKKWDTWDEQIISRGSGGLIVPVDPENPFPNEEIAEMVILYTDAEDVE